MARPGSAIAAALGLALSACASWGLPKQVLLSDRLAVGDRYEVAMQVSATGSGRTLEDGVVTESGSATSVDRERFIDTILAVEAGGRRSKVYRRYLLALLIHTPAGGKAGTTRRPLQGRTFTISRSGGDVGISSTKGLTDVDIEDVGTALRDDAEILVRPGMHGVGDTWPIPKRFFAAFNFQGIGEGICRFAGIEGPAGAELARITFTSQVSAVNASGRTSSIQMSGYVLWSLSLKRLVGYKFGGPSTTVFTTRRGASVTRSETESTVTVSATLTWKAIGGKPLVATPRKLPTGPAPSG